MEEDKTLGNSKRPTYIFLGIYKSHRFTLFIFCTIILLCLSLTAHARPLSVRINRWLELRALSGVVSVLQNGQWSQAQLGQRLGNVGDGIRTGSGSLARLALDTQIGFVGLSEGTDLRITELSTAQRGGKVTKLDVKIGQARLFMRRLTNPDSSTEIRTPSGVMGVRGTSFGIDIQPNGRSAVATLEGSVASSAAGQSVLVEAGFQSLTFPGEPPSQPVPANDDTSLNIIKLDRNRGMIEVQGEISPYNLLELPNK
ncbi:MAG: FecR domain-containing protein [Cyanobacteria bacterium P01_F01_bin.86]